MEVEIDQPRFSFQERQAKLVFLYRSGLKQREPGRFGGVPVEQEGVEDVVAERDAQQLPLSGNLRTLRIRNDQRDVHRRLGEKRAEQDQTRENGCQ